MTREVGVDTICNKWWKNYGMLGEKDSMERKRWQKLTKERSKTIFTRVRSSKKDILSLWSVMEFLNCLKSFRIFFKVSAVWGLLLADDEVVGFGLEMTGFLEEADSLRGEMTEESLEESWETLSSDCRGVLSSSDGEESVGSIIPAGITYVAYTKCVSYILFQTPRFPR